MKKLVFNLAKFVMALAILWGTRSIISCSKSSDTVDSSISSNESLLSKTSYNIHNSFLDYLGKSVKKGNIGKIKSSKSLNDFTLSSKSFFKIKYPNLSDNDLKIVDQLILNYFNYKEKGIINVSKENKVIYSTLFDLISSQSNKDRFYQIVSTLSPKAPGDIEIIGVASGSYDYWTSINASSYYILPSDKRCMWCEFAASDLSGAGSGAALGSLLGGVGAGPGAVMGGSISSGLTALGW